MKRMLEHTNAMRQPKIRRDDGIRKNKQLFCGFLAFIAFAALYRYWNIEHQPIAPMSVDASEVER